LDKHLLELFRPGKRGKDRPREGREFYRVVGSQPLPGSLLRSTHDAVKEKGVVGVIGSRHQREGVRGESSLRRSDEGKSTM